MAEEKKENSEQGVDEEALNAAPESAPVGDKEENNWEEKYKRSLADYQNLLKRMERDREEFVKYANEKFLEEILPIYDNLKISLEHADTEDKNNWIAGVKFVVRQFSQALKNAGVEEVEVSEQEFDHATMEAMQEEPTADKKRDNKIAKVLASGYKLNGRLIRPAKVQVYKFKE